MQRPGCLIVNSHPRRSYENNAEENTNNEAYHEEDEAKTASDPLYKPQPTHPLILLVVVIVQIYLF